MAKQIGIRIPEQLLSMIDVDRGKQERTAWIIEAISAKLHENCNRQQVLEVEKMPPGERAHLERMGELDDRLAREMQRFSATFTWGMYAPLGFVVAGVIAGINHHGWWQLVLSLMAPFSA